MGTISSIKLLLSMLWSLHGVAVRSSVLPVARFIRGDVGSDDVGAEPSWSGGNVDGWLSKVPRGRGANSEVELSAPCIVCVRVV